MTRFLSVVLCALFLFGCADQQFGAREKGAVGGGAIGAGLGAIIGNQVGSAGAGIAIGSAIGALSGGIIGNEVDKQDATLRDRDARLNAQEQELRENQKILDELRRRGTDARMTSRGVVVNLPDVLFNFDSADLAPSAQRTVDEIAEVINSSTNKRKIAVEGHTDSLGTATYNQRLSEARARAVAHELTAHGVPRGMISVRGYGESNPIASNNTEAGRSRNRRVEVILENRR